MSEKSEQYQFIKATVDCGELTWEYALEGRSPQRMIHDEDVDDWTDEDIVDLTVDMLSVDPTQRGIIEVIHE